MRRKPAPGVCSTCGAPVVQPTPAEYELWRRNDTYGRFEVRGHRYEFDEREGLWHLVNVGCQAHAENQLRSVLWR